MRSFGRFLVEGTMHLYVLWRKQRIRFGEFYSASSRNFNVHRLVFPFHFPNSNAKYQVNCYIWITRYTVQLKIEFFWILSHPVQVIGTKLWSWDTLKDSPIPLRWDVRIAVFFGEWEYWSHRWYQKIRNQTETTQQVKDVSQMNFTIYNCAATSRLQFPPTAVHHILLKCLPLFLYNFKIFNHWMKLSNNNDKNLLNIAVHKRRVTQDTFHNLFFLMSSFFASTGVFNKQRARIWVV